MLAWVQLHIVEIMAGIVSVLVTLGIVRFDAKRDARREADAAAARERNKTLTETRRNEHEASQLDDTSLADRITRP